MDWRFFRRLAQSRQLPVRVLRRSGIRQPSGYRTAAPVELSRPRNFFQSNPINLIRGVIGVHRRLLLVFCGNEQEQ